MNMPLQAAMDDKLERDAVEVEKVRKNMERRAKLQFITRRQIRCWKVFAFPVAYAINVTLFFLYYEGVFGNGAHAVSSKLLAGVFFGFILASIWITAHNAKFVATDTILKLESIPEEEWFTITGVVKGSPKFWPVKVTIVDPFGKVSTITSYGQVRKWVEGSPDQYIVTCLEPKWLHYAEQMHKSPRRTVD